ncbi:hypothetical protein [Magnetospira sp. QH-2]|uniref:hypothetical protein n=1 Tax=Magnetospira sp. (strain QH-2) TaxID=1288970 RepID=UPI0005F9D28B|nr:hypothetical protein [Magnetospira sp. QH-2]
MSRLFGLLIALILSWSTSATAGQLVVIESSLPALAPGQMIDAATAVTVPDGGKLVLISDQGTTLTLTGPFSGKPGGKMKDIKGGDGKLLTSLSKLVSGKQADMAALGTFRSGPSNLFPPLWSVNVQRSGRHCLPPSEPAKLWRPKSDGAANLRVKPLPLGDALRVTWPAGDQQMDWPETVLPSKDGSRYLVRLEDRPSAARVEFKRLPGDLPSRIHQAAWMADHGCGNQALTLLSSITGSP